LDALSPIIKDLNHKKFNWKATPDITADDFRKIVKQMFNAADNNRDGVLQLDEFKQFSLFILEALSDMQLFNQQQSAEDMFKKFDVNKDGVLEWTEIWQSVEPIYSKIKGKMYHWKTTKSTTAAEFKTMVKQMFDCADDNRDGVLQLDEFQQFTLFVLEGLDGMKISANSTSVDEMF
jgi:Ca2+-binding EF-hand superfamily protein